MRKIKLSDITQPKVYKIFKLKIFLFLLIAARSSHSAAIPTVFDNQGNSLIFDVFSSDFWHNSMQTCSSSWPILE
jgi:hypothetical protein